MCADYAVHNLVSWSRTNQLSLSVLQLTKNFKFFVIIA